MGEISYGITEPDQDREETQRHGGNDQSVFGESRSRLAGPKPPDELSHGTVQVPTFDEPDAGTRWRVIEPAGNMPRGDSSLTARLNHLGDNGFANGGPGWTAACRAG